MSSGRRLFFALWPSPAQQKALEAQLSDVVLAAGGRAVPAQNYHVTLAFVGGVPESSLGEVMSVGAQVAHGFAARAVSVELSLLEFWQKPRVLCATAPAELRANNPSSLRHSTAIGQSSGEQPAVVAPTSAAAAALAEQLKHTLVARKFAPDLKPFRAHVTLARKVSAGTRAAVMQSVLWTFNSCALIESQSVSGTPVYSVLASWILCGSQVRNA